MKEKRILLVGGGSGGHVYPLVAVAQSLKNKANVSGINLELMMLGGSFIERSASEANLPYRIISTGKLRRYSSINNFFDPLKFFIGFVQSFWHIFWFMPDAIFCKGGSVSIGPALIAKMFFIPFYIHESDSVPGLANSLLGGLADKVFISFKTSDKYFDISKVIFAGNPVRSSLAASNRAEALKYFDVSDTRKTILVVGGSQGAKIINDMILSSLVLMTEKYNVIHQCGESQFEEVKSGLEVIIKEGTDRYAEPVKKYYRLYSFFNEHEMALAYSVSDIVISRAGAGALFEIAQIGKPAVIIPIAQSNANHQYLNAFEFSLSGGVLIEEKNLIREGLLREVDHLLGEEVYRAVSEKIKTFATPDAAGIISSELLK